eukprot:TRINITY_DN13033_c0_g1_i1.p1 TRINITY_DN13033_c0_g1~~TRINITY_DN13033_c0_g1_i1.p1  ORF type:complete len:357 (+),score=-48.19 TRINITY_DN13033_c0_g1_i1:143-1072(+)
MDAGVHFGHKASRWNPKMAPYIYTRAATSGRRSRDETHIINLQYTKPMLNAALKAVYDVVRNNGKVLFVGTKLQASEIIAEAGEQSGQYYVNHRWLGGMLTNWGTVSKSIKVLEKLEDLTNDDEASAGRTKKELLEIERNKKKLTMFLGGIRNMGGRPDLMVVIDTNKEKLAIAEANKLGIPVVAIIDSNSNPDNITFPVPGNDDAIRSIRMYATLFSQAALAGIEDALIESGVDVGALTNNEEKFKAAKKAIKHQANRKFNPNKAEDRNENDDVKYDEGMGEQSDKNDAGSSGKITQPIVRSRKESRS